MLRALALLPLLALPASASTLPLEGAFARLRPALEAFKPVPAPALPPGTPKDYARLFNEGWAAATRALRSQRCEALFRSRGAPAGAALAALRATEYRFLALPQGESVGAQTNGPASVFINTKGVYVTAVDGDITLDNRRYELWDGAEGVRAMVLLHELGHEMGLFGPDSGSARQSENARHSLDVIDACVPGRPLP